MAEKIDAVLFDVNHTLIGLKEEESTQVAAVEVMFQEIRRRTGASITSDEFHNAYNNAWKTGKRQSFQKYEETRYEDIVARTLDGLGLSFSAPILEDVLQVYMEPIYRAAYIIPGMREVLEKLRHRVKIGIITNYKYASGMQEMLRRTGLSDLVDAATISSAVGWKKPAPVIYEAALRELETTAEQSVFVGNELEKDLWQAGRLGMRTILFVTDEHEMHDTEFAEILRQRIATAEIRADYVAASPAELSAVLEPLLPAS